MNTGSLEKAIVSAETKYQSRERREAVRNVLRKEWDPIGVLGISGADDEYDSYVGEIYLLLFEERATEETVASHLLQVAIERDSPRVLRRAGLEAQRSQSRSFPSTDRKSVTHASGL